MPLTVFVCTGNSCRSPMAEGLFRKAAAGLPGWEAASAGTAVLPGSVTTPEAVTAAAERGADISGHGPREIDRELMTRADVVIAMTRFHAEWLKRRFPESGRKVATLGEWARQDACLDIPDPAGQPLRVYQHTAGQLEQLLKEAVQGIRPRLG